MIADDRGSQIADRRSQKVLRSSAIIWKHTSAIACDPAIVIDRRRSGLKQEKNRDTGEKTTSANVQVADLTLAGSTSKNSKSLDFAAGDVKTGFKRENKRETDEKSSSANVQVGDVKLSCSN